MQVASDEIVHLADDEIAQEEEAVMAALAAKLLRSVAMGPLVGSARAEGRPPRAPAACGHQRTGRPWGHWRASRTGTAAPKIT